ncbi:putative membrane protein [Rhodococcus opacus]|uniref:Putative membrane protein n=1 Tax=Rhodococcus opacus TaxID=37919 RepID=A0A1B1K5R0_RHOOP|nr:hypothetical protein [Rhodococcus opacus]ANS27950.1 putative membrane protein [Rhodococcus opacus]
MTPHIEDSTPKTIIPIVAALWLVLAALAAWNTVAFAIASLAAVVLGCYLLASAVAGPHTADRIRHSRMNPIL